ncbi:hypothetical protein B4U16_06800 [Klebsiella pneumoniae]|nr:hypothetical protein [Klebsiella pneumoniae subsp. pneumoniae]OSB66297.1 hypothetical protein B4U16_06800 [Klebsiella pneumoniae]
MAQRVQLTATVTENQLGQRLDQALAELFPDYSRSRIKEWILDQRVLVNGTIGDKPKEKVLGENASLSMWKSKKRRASSRRIFRSISFTKMMTSS